jgi:flagellar motility protein MotE (MotC chaperone)
LKLFDLDRMAQLQEVRAGLCQKFAGYFGACHRNVAAMTRFSFLFHPASILVAIAFACVSVPGDCVEQKKAEAAKPAEPAATATGAKQFCANNLAIAGDAKIAWQTSKLVDLAAQIKQRLAELEARKMQLVEWLRKHDEAMKKAADDVVAIYAHMKPDAAASQLAIMDDAMAAAVIAKLPPRVAGTILNEMEPARAAQLTHGMLAPETAPEGKKS